jgi:hypothetical protein
MVITVNTFHGVYAKCCVETEALNNTPAFDKFQSELPKLLLIDEKNRDGAIIETITVIRKAFADTAPKKRQEVLHDFETNCQAIPQEKAFLLLFSEKIPFETNETVRTLYVKRIKGLQDDFKALHVPDVTEWLFSPLCLKTPNSDISAQDFHAIYIKCFHKPPTSYIPFTDESMRSELVRLLLIDPKDREGKIVEVIKSIRTELHEALLRLQQDSESVSKSPLFWNLFSDRLPIETDENIRKIVVDRVKALQDDFKKQGVENEAALRKCLGDPQFFPAASTFTIPTSWQPITL